MTTDKASFEEKLRLRAHYLWEADGSPEGRLLENGPEAQTHAGRRGGDHSTGGRSPRRRSVADQASSCAASATRNGLENQRFTYSLQIDQRDLCIFSYRAARS